MINVLWLVLIPILFIAGAFLGKQIERSQWQSWAIEQGLAHYDTLTGEYKLNGVTSQ